MRQRRFRLITVVLAAMLAAGAVLSQRRGPRRPTHGADRRALLPLTSPTGSQIYDQLTGRAVLCLAEDGRGNIWFGTAEGLTRYDGFGWEHVTVRDGLLDKGVRALARDGAAVLIGSESGIVRWVDGRIEPVLQAPAGQTWGVRSLAVPRTGVLWAATEHGAVRVAHGEVTLFRGGTPAEAAPQLGAMVTTIPDRALPVDAEGELHPFDAHDIAVDGTGRVWLTLAGGGVLRCGASTLTDTWSLALEPHRSGREPRLHAARDGAIWVAGTEGHQDILQRLENDAWSELDLGPRSFGRPIRSLAEGPDGTVWIGATDCLLAWRGGDPIRYAPPVKQFVDPLLLLTSEGSLWFANRAGQVFRVVRPGSGVARPGLYFACRSSDGMDWFRGRQRIVGFRSGKKVAEFGRKDGVPFQPVDIIDTARGLVCYGSDGEDAVTARFDGKTWYREVHAGYRTSRHAGNLHEDARGTLWLALKEPGTPATTALWCRSSDRWALVATGLAGRPRGFAEALGKLWLATTSGLLHAQADGVSSAPLPHEFAAGEVRAICAGSAGDLWVANETYGLFRTTDATSWTRFRSAPDNRNHILSLCRQADGTIWAATHAGLQRFDGTAWHPVHHFVRGGFAMRSVAGEGLWIKEHGHSVRLELEGDPPQTEITSTVENAGEGGAAFEWSGTDRWDSTARDDLTYSYRLDGSPWSAFDSRTTLLLTSLAPGGHVLEVRARDHNFNVDPTPAIARFVVPVPIWQRSWFLLLVGLLVSLATFQSVRLVQRGKRLGIDAARADEAEAARRRLEEEIAARKSAEEHRKHLEAQLLQAQKMEAIGQLAGGVAHDFNNVLTAILGHTSLIAERLDEQMKTDQDLQFSVAGIDCAAERAISLTRQLLTVGRRQVAIPRVLDPNRLLLDMQGMLERVISEDVDFQLDLDPSTACIVADRSMFDQVVMNLVVNARDAMSHGGKLRIRTRNVEWTEHDERAHPGCPPGRYVQLTVEDTGHGMSEATVERIFEPFFTTKPPGKGTGLGLSTVFGIVRQSEGFLTVESKTGHGTTFDVFLPASRVGAPADAVRSGARSPNGNGATILVCEDEEMVRSLISRALEAHGYQVLTAPDGSAALELAIAHKGEIDVLLTDMIMPGMSGREVARRIRAGRPDIAVLYASGYATEVIARHGVLEAGVDLLQKPFSPARLLDRVQQAIANRERATRCPPNPRSSHSDTSSTSLHARRETTSS